MAVETLQNRRVTASPPEHSELSRTAERLRDEVLREVAALSNASDAFFARWGRVQGQVVYDCGQFLGTPELFRLSEPLHGALAQNGSPVHGSSYERHGWDLLRPHAYQINQFRYLHEDIPDQDGFAETMIFRSFYGPLEVREQLRALVYDDTGRSMGLIAALSRGNERFEEGVRERLDARMPAWLGLLRAAEQLEREALLEDPSYALVRPWDGEVEFATPGLMEALTLLQRQQLAVWCRLCFEDDQLLSQTCVYGMSVQSVRVEGTAGPRQLLTFQSSEPLRLSPVHVLNPRQRQIFDLVVSGSSNAEIAARLELSPNTVKYHLKTIFNALGVSSRGALLTLADSLGVFS